MRHIVSALLSLAVASCERATARPLGPPARLVAGRADTVVVNSRNAVTLPVQVLDEAGHELPTRGLRFERVSGDPLSLSPSGRITCERRGDAEVRVSLGALSTRFALRCRPIKGFRFIYGDGRPLVSGGAPRELQFVAVGVDDMPERMLAGTLSIVDSSVAELRGLTVRPRAPGSTMVELDLGECFWAIGVAVHERVASPSELRSAEDLFLISPLRLVDGERRGWRLPRGEYRVGLLTQAGVDTKLELGTTNMNCVPWITGGQDYNCIALAGAAVDVRNPRRAGAGGELYGELFAQRMDLPPRATRDESATVGTRRQRPRKRSCPMVR
ncbi:MAG: hypothetical protein ACJ79A_16390 [Gemmatimonadaceae bacterium]